MTARRNLRPFRTRKAKHGTQYLYRVPYRDVSDRDYTGVARLWAYDAEHALERFYDTPDQGWKPGTPKREREKR